MASIVILMQQQQQQQGMRAFPSPLSPATTTAVGKEIVKEKDKEKEREKRQQVCVAYYSGVLAEGQKTGI